jgi:hypothetical protein
MIGKAGAAAVGTPLAGKIGVSGILKAAETEAPLALKVAKGAGLFGVDTAVTDTGEWKDNPSEKLYNVLKGSMFGASMGTIGGLFESPIAKLGAYSGFITTKTAIEAKIGGASTQDALIQVVESWKSILAFEIAGRIQNKGRMVALGRSADKSAFEKFKTENPEISNKQIWQHVKAAKNAFRMDSIGKIKEQMLKPFRDLEAKGLLVPEEKRQLDRFEGLLKQKEVLAEKEKLAAEDVLAKSKFVSAKHKELAARMMAPSEEKLMQADLAIKTFKRVKELNLSIDEQRALIYDATSEVVRKGGQLEVVKSGIYGPVGYGRLNAEQLTKVLGSMNRFSTDLEIQRKEAAFGFSTNEARLIRLKAGNNNDIYARVLDTADWPLSNDKTLRRMEIENLQRNAYTMRRAVSPEGWIKNARLLNALNPKAWASTRYYFDWLTRATGKNVDVLKELAEEAYKTGHAKWSEAGKVLLDEVGLSKNRLLSMSAEEKQDVAEYMFDRSATRYLKLSPEMKKAVDGFERVLDEGSMTANKVRGIMWYIMNSAYSKVENQITAEKAKASPDKKKLRFLEHFYQRTRPSDVKPATVERLVLEGRAAMKAGKLYDWLASNKFGTRETYFMTEHQWNKFQENFTTMMTSPTLELYKSKLKQRAIKPEFTYGREEGAKPNIADNPFSRIENHMHKVFTLFEMYPHFERLNNSLVSVDHLLKPQDRASLDVYRDTLLGRYSDPGPIIRAAMKANKFWWDAYSSQPTRFLYFGYRNLFQNLGMLPGQISPIEFGKAVFRLGKDGRSIKALEDYKEWFASNISERQQIWETMTLTERSEFSQDTHFNAVRNFGKNVISGSDELNRLIAFWPIHDIAEHNLKLYRGNKISSERLISRLKIRSLAPGQEQRLINHLKHDQDLEFIKRYTIEKITNAHFKYDSFARSLIEQDSASKALIGLITWTRGGLEAYDKQVLRPVIDGIRLKNWRRGYEGVKNAAEMTAGLTLSQQLMESSFGVKGAQYGKSEYGVQGVVQVSPLTPGLDWLIDTVGIKDTIIDNMVKLVSDGEDARKSGMTPEAFIENILKKGIKQGTYVIPVPMIDVMPVVWSKANNKEGMTWWHIVKELSPRYDAALDRSLESTQQSTVEKFATGFMNTERP